MNPHEVREQMTRGLQRRLIGPLTNTPDETSWPGEYVEPKIVDDKFAEPKTYPILNVSTVLIQTRGAKTRTVISMNTHISTS